MFSQISPKISAIPTTLITGFLGVGKTTAILQLLANKPNNENWAVLVNEFGEIGIDSALLTGNSAEQGVFIREVPGGCMCCASGVPMQVALNQLITKAKPDRLLIEPTGLGHPKEVVEVLSKGKFQESISLQSILCLVDARNLIDKRYTEHPSFVQQLNVADTILAAKADTYSVQDKENLASFITENELTDKPLHLMQHGNIDPSWLAQQPKTVRVTKPIIGIAAPSLHESSHQIEVGYKKELEQSQALQTRLALEGFIELNNHGEGYFSIGLNISEK
jgi:G3E family GTPase